ncbi:MAG: OmpH family outer membrane protein [Gammaproteobacteria bacterium]|nr:OmpH family outer membrane protein [Gammaproteobacteria bacterium]
MIKRLAIWSLFLLTLGAGVASAELNVAVLDTQRALIESEEAKILLKRAQEELQKEEDSVRSLGEEILALQEKLKTDGEVMSATEQRKMTKDIEDKQIDYQFLVNKLQKQVNDRRQELLAQMVPKIDKVLKDLIEIEGYDMIMERGNLRYVNSRHDITRKVTEKLNENRQKQSEDL